MKKKLLAFFFLIFVFPKIATATETYCSNNLDQLALKSINSLKIKNITVEVDKYKRWTRNSLNILIGNFRWIPKRFKKRFDADVKVEYENDITCSFQARIRNNGNQKDHIALKGNSIIQSIDVHLKFGQIYGITKFKLLRPVTRGNYIDEIFLTELLREFNYLAPRTSYIDTKINGVESKMLFQEKPAKELLEFNLRKNGPIFEGDERFVFRLAATMPDNQLSNLSIGMLPLIEKGINGMLARQINSEWINENNKRSIAVYDALSNLNRVYLLYSNKYKDHKNNFDYSRYNLDNSLLALNDPKNTLKLDIHNLIVFAANGWHGLVPHNRKFYWNAFENYFEPINSDTNANIKVETYSFPLPISDQIDLAFNDVEKLLSYIDAKKLNQKLILKGLELNNNQVKKKVNKIKTNLYKLKTIYHKIDSDILKHNRNNQIKKEMWKKYYASLYKINPNVYLVKQSPNNLFKRCAIKSLICRNFTFNKNQLLDLLEGKLMINSREYQYLGKQTQVE